MLFVLTVSLATVRVSDGFPQSGACPAKRRKYSIFTAPDGEIFDPDGAA